MFKLDFSLVTSEEREKYIEQFNLTKLKPSELELCANYVLYGKDKDGKSLVDKKYIYINTKYNSFAVSRPESLDALMENPNFDESIFSVSRKNYKIVKPTIDREKDKDIPTITEMWESIDRLQYILDVNTGKIDDPTVKRLNDTQIYKLRHILIDIRRGQFYLKDIFKPTINYSFNRVNYIAREGEFDIDWDDPGSDYGFAPLGLIGESGVTRDVFFDLKKVGRDPILYNKNAKHIIDFRDPTHIYKLLDQYEEFMAAAIDKPDNLLGLIPKTLDYYIGAANLKEQHYTIIQMKIRKCTNKQITNKLTELYGLHHTENYISTIWTQKICVEIANAAVAHYDMFLLRHNEENWKVCNTCGKTKLRDNRYFVKKSKTKDGLSGRCKVCDRKIRELNKAKKRKLNSQLGGEK